MELPFGEMDGKRLVISFSTADFSIASVLCAVREHLDMLSEMGMTFLGAATDVPPGPSPVFKPVSIKAIFEYTGGGETDKYLERTYEIIWQGIVNTFPGEAVWAESKKAYAEFIRSQAELLRARAESAPSDKPNKA